MVFSCYVSNRKYLKIWYHVKCLRSLLWDHNAGDDDDEELFCGMVDRRKAFTLISSRDHCQRSSPSGISDTPRQRFETAQNLSSGLVERSCAVVITTKPRSHIFDNESDNDESKKSDNKSDNDSNNEPSY